MQGSVAPTPHLRRIGGAIAIASVVAILFATLLPAPDQSLDSHLCLVCGTRGGVDAILNVLLFLPLGIGLALSGVPWKRAILTSCALSITLEATQFFFIPGRDATLGDVLTNTVGGAVGFAVANNSAIWLRTPPRIAAVLGMVWCGIWLAIQAISSFAFSPSIPDSKEYGQIARKFENLEAFPGQVLDARLGAIAITDTELRETDSVGHRVLGGGTLTVIVLSTKPTTGIAPIVRIADDQQREILLLAQDEQQLLFAVRTGAAILRLRPPLFAMPHVFAGSIAETGSSSSQPLRLTARYDGRESQLTARTPSMTRRRDIRVSAALGWTLVLPFQWYIEDTPMELAISLIWTACLTVPIGYLGVCIARRTNTHWSPEGVALGLVAGAATLIAGLVVIPHVFGLPAASMRDWSAVVLGIVGGGALAAYDGKRRRAEEIVDPVVVGAVSESGWLS
ncbi:MAG: hypothetical protein QOD47_2561 [Gemmatimonadaceae bacterium]|nr:hypothetical protein [Gemmatimonadaceae bacterium]